MVRENSLQSIKHNLGLANRLSTLELVPDTLNVSKKRQDFQADEEEIDELQDSLEELCERMGDSFENDPGIDVVVEDSPNLPAPRQQHLIQELIEQVKDSQSFRKDSAPISQPLQSPCPSKIISQGSRNGSPLFLKGLDHAILTRDVSCCSTISIDDAIVDASCERIIVNDSFPISTRLDEVVPSFQDENVALVEVAAAEKQQQPSPLFQPDTCGKLAVDTIFSVDAAQPLSQNDPSSGHSLQESFFEPGQKQKKMHQQEEDIDMAQPRSSKRPGSSPASSKSKKKAKFFSSAIDQNIGRAVVSDPLLPLQIVLNGPTNHQINVNAIVQKHHDALSLELSDYFSREATAASLPVSSPANACTRQLVLVEVDPNHHWDGMPSSPHSSFNNESHDDFQLPASFF